jgi:acetamidase/formamidase
MRWLPVVLALTPALAHAESAAGRWIMTIDSRHTTLYESLSLEVKGETISGKFDGEQVSGSLRGNQLHLSGKSASQGEELTAVLSGDRMIGSYVITDPADPRPPEKVSFSATRATPHPAGPARRHEFVPTHFYREFSPTTPPVLRIAPGDSVHTTTVDAAGDDEKGKGRVFGGNPETGPFYVESAWPGDTLVVHLKKVRLNRDYAVSDDYLVPRAVDGSLAAETKDLGSTVRWHLDRERGVATPEKPGAHLKHYSVPLRPMLGCIAVAPGPASAAPNTGDSGRYGGNMDFNEVVEGSTVYLPVSVPGALLYLGDGHAAQGDGELNGNALETSMEVEFSVEVLADESIPGPRVETSQNLITVGLDGSLDDALKSATANMTRWLMSRYQLTVPEIAQVLGTSSEYHVSEIADRNVGMVLKIRKDRLELPAAGAAH